MIDEFEQEEQYEKCAVLTRARESVINRKPFAPIEESHSTSNSRDFGGES